MPPLGEGTRLISVDVVLVGNGVQQVTAANSELVLEGVTFDRAIGALCRRIEGGKLTLTESSVALVVLRDAWKHELLSEGWLV